MLIVVLGFLSPFASMCNSIHRSSQAATRYRPIAFAVEGSSLARCPSLNCGIRFQSPIDVLISPLSLRFPVALRNFYAVAQCTNRWKKSDLQEPLFFSATGFLVYLFAYPGNCPNWIGVVHLSKKIPACPSPCRPRLDRKIGFSPSRR